VNDRLLVPNTSETFATLEPEVQAFFDKLYCGEEFTLAHYADARERFTINVKTESIFDVDTLLKNLTVETAHA